MSNEDLYRFFQEAEFVQALANIDYVLWLANEGCFTDPAFVNFLEYLLYFRIPEFSIHLSFPRGVQILELLVVPAVRQLLIEEPMTFRRIVADQLWSSWARSHEWSKPPQEV
jgi:mediator of RNA polymerase II transcription subunit 31